MIFHSHSLIFIGIKLLSGVALSMMNTELKSLYIKIHF